MVDELNIEVPKMKNFKSVMRFIVMKTMSMTPAEQRTIALVEGLSGARTSLATMMVHSMGLATEWRGKGVTKDSLVTIMMDNCTDYYIPVFAAWLCGAGVSLSDPDLMPRSLISQLQLTQSNILVASTRVVKTALEAAQVLGIQIYTIGDNKVDLTNIEDFYETSNRDFEENHTTEKEEHDIAAVFWSSGTTGEPKGIPYHQKFIFSTALFSNVDERSPNLITTCMFHVVGFLKVLNYMIVNKQSCIYLDSNCSALDIVQTIHDWSPVRALVKSFHPARLVNLKAEHYEKLSLESLEDLVPVGAPVPSIYEPSCFKLFKGLKAMISNYGLTELGVISISNTMESIGKPVPGVEVKIIDPETGEIQLKGKAGEIWVKTDVKIKNYFNSELSIWDESGWAHTGDLAYVNDTGDMVFVDRLKSLIKCDGKHVQPGEIVNLLLSEPSVVDAFVFGVPDPFHQELVTAAVVLTQDADETELEEIRNRINAGIEEHKRIRGNIFTVQELPRNAHGKVLRRKLIDQFIEKSKVTETDIEENLFSKDFPSISRLDIHSQYKESNMKGRRYGE